MLHINGLSDYISLGMFLEEDDLFKGISSEIYKGIWVNIVTPAPNNTLICRVLTDSMIMTDIVVSSTVILEASNFTLLAMS